MIAGRPIHGYGVFLLSNIEQENLYRKYDFTKDW